MPYTEPTLKNIPLDQIDIGVRARKDYPNMDDLIYSISDKGLINPIAVLDKREVADKSEIAHLQIEQDRPYLLLAGGRRYNAFMMLDEADSIPCRVYDHALNELEIKQIELIENIQREDLSWQEEIDLKAEIHDIHVKLYGTKTARGTKGHTLEDTAQMLGESRANLSLDLGLKKAMDRMPDLRSAKTKTEARQKANKLKREIDKENQVKTIEKSKSDKPEEQKKKKLAQSYIVGDFFEKVKGVKNNSIDLVELDPPYGIDLGGTKKGEADNRESYNEVDAEFYFDFLDNTLSQCKRVLKPNGWLIFWFGPEPWWSVAVELLNKHEFTFKQIPGIWDKGYGQTMRPELYLANTYEMFFYARKSNGIINKQGAGNIFKHRPVPSQYKIHPTERPIEMIQDVISTFTKPGSNILTPFAGSGNTILASANLGCTCVGYDLSEEYRNDFYLRVHSGTYGEYTSYPNGK